MGQPLPEILDEIASVIGREAMLTLVAAHGGTRIYIPATATSDHWLVSVLGEANATALCDHFRIYSGGRGNGGGTAIELPAFTRSSYNKTKELIHQLDDGTASASQIALVAGVTERTVYRQRKKRLQKRSR